MAKLVKSIYTGSDVTALGEITATDTLEGAYAGQITTDNDLSFDLSAGNNFKCTPTSTGTLTFTNLLAGQAGNVYLDNTAAVVISAASSVYISATDLSAINGAGVHWLSYYTDGTNVLCSVASTLTSAGA